MEQIKVGFLASYDYLLLKNALPLVYDFADTITIALDKNRMTWSGQKFNVDGDFFEWLRTIDSYNKITVYEDDFYNSAKSPMENETSERNLLAEHMGSGGWHIQLDADEYFINFSKFVDFLRNRVDDYLQYSNEPVLVYTRLVTLFKRVTNGYLYITSNETGPVATRHPTYQKARSNGESKLITNYTMIHHSWARKNDEILTKLNNWGHRDDFNTLSYYNFWSACDEHNFRFYNMFHPVYPELWSSLEYLESQTIEEFTREFSAKNALSQQVEKCEFHPNHVIKKRSWISRLLKK